MSVWITTRPLTARNKFAWLSQTLAPGTAQTKIKKKGSGAHGLICEICKESCVFRHYWWNSISSSVRIIHFLDRQGKTFMKYMEDTSQYPLAFPEANYTSNSHSYLLIKFYPSMAPYLVLKITNFTQYSKFAVNLSSMCATRGKIFLILTIHTYK